ncbi:MAG: PEP-CTERM sorting domain-containing protein [Verrucomicrobiota bacterium]
MKKELILTALLAGLTPSFGVLNVALPGLSQRSSWEDLNSSNYPTSSGYNSFFTNTAGWSTPISADVGSVTFDKVAGGGGYPASTSIYNFDTPGSFFISASSPISGLETVVFQIDMVGAISGGPTLSYNGGAQELAADISENMSGNFAFGGSPSTINAYQWDLSAIGVTISDFTIEWDSIAHSASFAMQLDSGNAFEGTVIPEPSTYALIFGVASGLLLMRRMRR